MHNPPLELWRWHSSYSGLWWGTGELYFISQDCFLCRVKGFNNQQLQPFGRKEEKSSVSGRGRCFLAAFCATTGRRASKPKINHLQIVAACHRHNPVAKSLINFVFASTVNLADPLQESLLPPQHLTTLNQWVKGSSEQGFLDGNSFDMPSAYSTWKLKLSVDVLNWQVR